MSKAKKERKRNFIYAGYGGWAGEVDMWPGDTLKALDGMTVRMTGLGTYEVIQPANPSLAKCP